jgi:hypothetical protein
LAATTLDNVEMIFTFILQFGLGSLLVW